MHSAVDSAKKISKMLKVTTLVPDVLSAPEFFDFMQPTAIMVGRCQEIKIAT
jgi:hypothetical protein